MDTDTDVVLAFSPVGDVAFERPTTLVPLEHVSIAELAQIVKDHPDSPIAALLGKVVPDRRPTRVALVGAGQAASECIELLLSGPDGRRVDTVVLVDPAAPMNGTYMLGTKSLDAVAAFSRLAAMGARLAVLAGSDAPADPLVRSAAVLLWLWREVTGAVDPRLDHAAPEGALSPAVGDEYLHATGYLNRGALWCFDYATATPEMMAGAVAPLIQAFLVPRWNAIAPLDQICLASNHEVCFRSTYLSDAYLAGQAEPSPLDIDPAPNPVLPQAVVAPAPPDTTATMVRWVGGIAATVAVAELLRRGFRYLLSA